MCHKLFLDARLECGHSTLFIFPEGTDVKALPRIGEMDHCGECSEDKAIIRIRDADPILIGRSEMCPDPESHRKVHDES